LQFWPPNRECLFIQNVLKVGWLLFPEQRAVEICRAGSGAMEPGEPLRIEPALTRGRGSCCRGYGWSWQRSGAAQRKGWIKYSSIWFS